MQAGELGHTKRKLAIRTQTRPKHMTVPRAVRCLHADLFVFIFAGHEIHVVVEHVVMAGGLEQLGATQLRRHDFLVAVERVQAANEIDETVVDHHAFGQIERRARRYRVHVIEVERHTDAAVIALLGLFNTGEV